MSQEGQGKKISQAISDAAVKEELIILAKPTDLSDEDLDKVAAGLSTGGGQPGALRTSLEIPALDGGTKVAASINLFPGRPERLP